MLLLTTWTALTTAMTAARIAELREETVSMFYHGFDNYMHIAFPEDEVGAQSRPQNVVIANADLKLTSIAATCFLRTSDARFSESAQCRTE